MKTSLFFVQKGVANRLSNTTLLFCPKYKTQIIKDYKFKITFQTKSEKQQ